MFCNHNQIFISIHIMRIHYLGTRVNILPLPIFFWKCALNIIFQRAKGSLFRPKVINSVTCKETAAVFQYKYILKVSEKLNFSSRQFHNMYLTYTYIHFLPQEWTCDPFASLRQCVWAHTCALIVWNIMYVKFQHTYGQFLQPKQNIHVGKVRGNWDWCECEPYSHATPYCACVVLCVFTSGE